MARFANRRSPASGAPDLVGYAVAGLAPVVTAALLVPLRAEVNQANLALVLVVVVVLAAMVGGRGPGALAVVMTTISYDFFLTRPYQSMTIDSADDVETTIILLVIGLLVGQLVVGVRRHRGLAGRGSDEVMRVHRVAEFAAAGVPADELADAIGREFTELLGLRACRFEPSRTGPPLAGLDRNGAITGVAAHRFAGDQFALPEAGVELLVLGRGREFGRFVLVPDPTHGVSLEERMVAVALSDQLGAVLAAETQSTPSTK